jgi:hypothetical protein
MHVLIWSARQMRCFQLQQGQACLTIFELPARKQAKALKRDVLLSVHGMSKLEQQPISIQSHSITG